MAGAGWAAFSGARILGTQFLIGFEVGLQGVALVAIVKAFSLESFSGRDLGRCPRLG